MRVTTPLTLVPTTLLVTITPRTVIMDMVTIQDITRTATLDILVDHINITLSHTT